MWRDFYWIELYWDSNNKMSTITFDKRDQYKLEAQANNYYNQLRAMGAKGEIRVNLTYRDEKKDMHTKQVAFVSLYEPEFNYVETP